MLEKVDTRRLPRSSSAAAYHSLRVYHQLQEWLGNKLEPLEYGWSIRNSTLTPTTTDLPIESEHYITANKISMQVRLQEWKLFM